MERKYAIGIDFGTLSARAILVDVQSGQEAATAIYGYQDAVIDQMLPYTDVQLPDDYALQNPSDYKDAVSALLRDLRESAGVPAEDIISIGIDFTACTVLPVDRSMQPLCFREEFRGNPHSWAKLWKHHGAQKEADEINRVARERGESFIRRYGNTSSSEWFFAKLMEIGHKAPEIYQATYKFVEAGDWVVWLLTGKLTTSTCMAGYKAFWSPEEGYPSREFFAAVDPKLKDIVDKAVQDVYTVGTRAGGLTEEMARITGLRAGTSVAVSMIDAHAAGPAVGVLQDDSMVLAMGTSLCHILVNRKEVLLDGIGGVVRDGVVPGYYGYEAGQAAVGDIYNWFISNLASADCFEQSAEDNISPLAVMDARAARLRPGESGLLALDWWNGNRSMLNNANLSGLITGLTLATREEEIYRAIIEATAFGTRAIVEAMEQNGVHIGKIFACGGLSRKSELVMQVFSDVLGREITVTGLSQGTAYGAAMYGMVAAGAAAGGFDTMDQAMRALAKPPLKSYRPDMQAHQVYSRIFEWYLRVQQFFGVENRDIMQGLKEIKAMCNQQESAK